MNIVLVDDHAVVRQGYASLLRTVLPAMQVREAASGEEALARVQEQVPNLVIMDFGLPGISGLETTRRLRQRLPQLRVLFFSMHDELPLVRQALDAGASGYLTKNTPPQKILDAVNEVMLGGGPMSAHIARMVVNSFQRSKESPLTKRETEILEQIANGKTRGKIADEFFIDLETVKSHLKNIYSKLDVHSKAEAIKTARMNKFI